MEPARRLFSNLFPSRCILCQQTIIKYAVNQHIEICAECYQFLPHNVHCCAHCALPLSEDMGLETVRKSAILCGRCIKQDPQFDYAYSLFRYQDEVIRLVHRLKFGEKISYARSIGELLLKKMTDELLPEQGEPECIIPVPLHNSRLRKRGYNQATEISRLIAKKTDLPIEQNLVLRQRSTLTQTGLKVKQRQKNIKGAFKMTATLNVKHVLIIDDVITTGATVNELAKVLKKSGIERIGVLSIARAPLKS